MKRLEIEREFEREFEHQQGCLNLKLENNSMVWKKSLAKDFFFRGNILANKELNKIRGYYTESVCKECKCEANTSVNHDTIKRNLEMKTLLKDLYKWIDVENEGVSNKSYKLSARIVGILGEEYVK